MSFYQRIAPSAALRNVVAYFSHRAAHHGREGIVRPLHARTGQFFEFYLCDPYMVRDLRTGSMHAAPRAVLVNPNTWRREDLQLTGTLRVFSVHFHPGGLYRLTGLPAAELTDSVLSLESAFGAGATLLTEQLSDCAGSLQMRQVAESWLQAIGNSLRASSRMHAVAQSLQRSRGAGDILALARAAGLSLRQLERTFRHEIGLTPKHFARITRFQHALALRDAFKEASWAEVADLAGYFDQAHLNRDTRAFAGLTPPDLYRQLSMTATAPSPGNGFNSSAEKSSQMSHSSKTGAVRQANLPACTALLPFSSSAKLPQH